MNLKVCLIVDTLSKGGAERAASILSKLFTSAGICVTIVALRGGVSYEYSGDLIHIGKQHSSIKFIKQFQKIIRLRRALKKIEANFVIDFRMRNRAFMELILHLFVFKASKMIYRINSFRISWHLPKGRFFKWIYNKGKLVAVSKDIKRMLEEDYGFNNVSYIPNTFQGKIDSTKTNTIKEEYIIALGSLRNEIKQFDKLIETYASSVLPKQNIHLYILGEGKDRKILEKQIQLSEVRDKVHLLGFIRHPETYVKNARYLVSCSTVEGFPNGLLEALNLRTPVISFDCKSGPSEMIVDKKNGLLIKDQDFEALKKAMEMFVLEDKIYKYCKANTGKYLEDFLPERSQKNWLELLNLNA